MFSWTAFWDSSDCTLSVWATCGFISHVTYTTFFSWTAFWDSNDRSWSLDTILWRRIPSVARQHKILDYSGINDWHRGRGHPSMCVWLLWYREGTPLPPDNGKQLLHFMRSRALIYKYTTLLHEVVNHKKKNSQIKVSRKLSDPQLLRK